MALTEGALVLHTGIHFRDDRGDGRIIHLAWHYRLQVDTELDDWLFVPATVDPIELQVLAGKCVVLDAVRPRLPYGFNRGASSFDSLGRFTPGPGSSGLTCATFVQAVFDWAMIPLLDENWETRPDDVAIRLATIESLRRVATAEHIAALESEVGCMRFRPEEVAAATALEPRPVPFKVGSEEGARLKESFDAIVRLQLQA